MKKVYKLNCYRKGYCHMPHPRDSRRWITEEFILSVWTASKKYYYLVAESIRNGSFCALRVKTLLEATIRLREMYDLLKEPNFSDWDTESKKEYEAAVPCSLMWRMKSKTTQRLPISEGLLCYSQHNGDPTVFMLTALGRHDKCSEK